MNIQLHRKQVIMLLLAMLLAIASYWIPLPQQPTYPEERAKLSKPAEKTKLVEPLAFTRESATMWRFPITVAIPQPAQPDPGVESGGSQPGPSWAGGQLIDAREIDNGFQVGKPAFAPTRDRDRSVQ